MKTTKGGKVMNPTDAYRKDLRKKELKRNKKERKKVREVGILKKDPETLKEQIEKLEMMKADGALDKARKHKKRQLEDTLNLVMKKRKEYDDKMREKGETPVMFSHLGPVRKRTAAEEDERANHPKPEDSVYYHPTLNPTGAPPPGKPPMYKLPIGSRPSNAASTSMSELDEADFTVPPPPPPPPLPINELSSAADSDLPKSLPVPPPPPVPSKSVSESSSLMGPPPPPPPLPSAPSEPKLMQPPLPPPPPGTTQTGRENKQNASSNDESAKTFDRAAGVLPPPPPPPPGLPPKLADLQSANAVNEYNVSHNSGSADVLKVRLPPPPPPLRHLPSAMPRFPLIPSSQSDMLPPGTACFPPPPPPPSDLRPPGLMPGIPNLPPPPPPPGMLVPLLPMPPYGVPPGPPPMGGLQSIMRSAFFPGHPFQEDENTAAARLSIHHKPSYVKSAASTVVKRPLAQHTPELTAMIPASVRVRREVAVPKAKPKSQVAVSNRTSKPLIPTVVMRSEESRAASSATKPQSIDDSYTAFLEDMKALGALDS